MNLMDWHRCEREFVRNVEKDTERIASIREQALLRLAMVRILPEKETMISFIVEGLYEVIKELLTAYLLHHGMRSQNHQCLITFFYKKNPDYEAEANLISQMSYYRNRLTYYGETIPKEFYEKNKNEIDKIIKLIDKLIGV